MVSSSGGRARTDPPPGPRWDRTTPARDRLWSTLARYPSGTRVPAAISLVVAAFPPVDAKNATTRNAYSAVWENMRPAAGERPRAGEVYWRPTSASNSCGREGRALLPGG